jgi:hypothetical protein
MKHRRYFWLITIILWAGQNAMSQQNLVYEAYVRSIYVPRGYISTRTPTIEGSLTYFVSDNYRINLWGLSSMTKKYSEIDLTLEYQYKNITLSLIDYYNPSANSSFNYFSLEKYSNTHTLDFILFYRISNKFPLSLKWSSYIYGSDYDLVTGKRLYSTYIEFSYPTTWKSLSFNYYAGFVPWKSWYADRLTPVNCGVKMDVNLLCREKVCVPSSLDFKYNPYLGQFNLNLLLGFQMRTRNFVCCNS